MKTLMVLALCASLTACGTPSEPRIETKIVEKAVPVFCTIKLGDRPDLQTKDVLAKALAAAPSFDDRLKIVTEQLLLYMGWTPKVEAAYAGCSTTSQRPVP